MNCIGPEDSGDYHLPFTIYVEKGSSSPVAYFYDQTVEEEVRVVICEYDKDLEFEISEYSCGLGDEFVLMGDHMVILHRLAGCIMMKSTN